MKINLNKTILYIIASLFMGFVVFNNLEQKETIETADKPKPYYEEVIITTQVDEKNIAKLDEEKVKLQQTGLIQKLKLKHNRSYTMEADEKNLYILTTASDNLYNTSQNEKETGNFLEVYDLASLELKHYVKLGEKKDTFNHYNTIEVNDTHIYIGTRNAYVIYSPKDDPFSNRPFKVLENKGHRGKINGIKAHKEYLFVYDEGGNIVVFKNNKYLYMIQTYPKIAPKTKYI